ncbi:hypothetical protein ACJVDH_15940 [Pedobacter sp. AW1-32]|uniref:hypothetical protein n=1 Tax=Pedobacter sp. AW1-32 TaxID=3383026 RepID=UPI003FF0A69A
MSKVNFSKKELVLQLKKQLSAIEDICEMYDKGNKTYLAQDLAVKIRVIFHNTSNSKSLMHLLKLNHISMFCTCTSYDPKNQIKTHLGLANLTHQVGYGWDYGCDLKLARATKVSIENWWNSKKIIVDSEGNILLDLKLLKPSRTRMVVLT